MGGDAGSRTPLRFEIAANNNKQCGYRHTHEEEVISNATPPLTGYSYALIASLGDNVLQVDGSIA